MNNLFCCARVNPSNDLTHVSQSENHFAITNHLSGLLKRMIFPTGIFWSRDKSGYWESKYSILIPCNLDRKLRVKLPFPVMTVSSPCSIDHSMGIFCQNTKHMIHLKVLTKNTYIIHVPNYSIVIIPRNGIGRLQVDRDPVCLKQQKHHLYISPVDPVRRHWTLWLPNVPSIIPDSSDIYCYQITFWSILELSNQTMMKMKKYTITYTFMMIHSTYVCFVLDCSSCSSLHVTTR